MSEPSRQKQVGARMQEQTRARLLEAAADEFFASGYVGATVARIAQRAGVTVQTLYSTWGSKRALLRAHTVAILAEGDNPTAHFIAQFQDAEPADAAEAIDAIAHIFTTVAVRASGLWDLHRNAAAVDPDVAQDWRELQELRRQTVGHLAERIPTIGLRKDIAPAAVADGVWVQASPETWHLLTEHGGFDAARYETWLRDTLRRVLLKNPTDA